MVCEVSKRDGAPCAQSGLTLPSTIINNFVSSSSRFNLMGLVDATSNCHESTPCIAHLPHPMGRLGQLQATVCLDYRTDADEKRGHESECLLH